jgi:hypothetical protein
MSYVLASLVDAVAQASFPLLLGAGALCIARSWGRFLRSMN